MGLRHHPHPGGRKDLRSYELRRICGIMLSERFVLLGEGICIPPQKQWGSAIDQCRTYCCGYTGVDALRGKGGCPGRDPSTRRAICFVERTIRGNVQPVRFSSQVAEAARALHGWKLGLESLYSSLLQGRPQSL